MAELSSALPKLLTDLYRLSATNEELWQKVGDDTYRATLSAGTVEITGKPTPHGLKAAIEQTWAGATGTFLWDWLSIPLKPVLLLAASRNQSTYKWPDRTLRILAPNGTTNDFFVDHENPIYSQVSRLLLVAELAIQTSNLADTIGNMSTEIDDLLADKEEETEQSDAHGAADHADSEGQPNAAAR